MHHVAIDLGGRESQVCIRDAEGRVVEEGRYGTTSLRRLFKKIERSRVIVETCAEAFQVADWAREFGHEVRVVPATLSRALGVGARGIKTDRRDALALSEASCRIDLPSVHTPSQNARDLKTLCGMRDVLVQSRTSLICTVRSWLRMTARRVTSGTTESFTKRVRAQVKELPRCVEGQLAAIDALSEQIARADEELAAIAKESEVPRRLMTIPGVGPVTAVRFFAAIDEIGRFGSAHALESYLGLTPGEQSSSERRRRTGITKAGPAAVRWTLIQAAWSARRTRRGRLDPMVQWSLEVERRRGKRTAIVALARKLAGVMFAVWRDGTSYNPARMLEARERHQRGVAVPA